MGAPFTEARFDGKVVSGSPQVMNFADNRYSPASGSGYLWQDAPVLASLCDPGIAYMYRQDFGSDYVAADWTHTGVGTTPTATLATSSITSRHNLKIDTNTSSLADGINSQLSGLAAHSLAAGKSLWLEARLATSDATNDEWCFGLSTIDTTMLTKIVAGSLTDFVGFMKTKLATPIVAKTTAGTTTTTSATVGTDTTAVARTLGIRITSNTKVEFYIDDVLVVTHTTNIPTGVMTIGFAARNGATTAYTFFVDYIAALQIR